MAYRSSLNLSRKLLYRYIEHGFDVHQTNSYIHNTLQRVIREIAIGHRSISWMSRYRLLVFRPHRLQAVHRRGILLQMSHIVSSVCLCVLDTRVYELGKTRLNRSRCRFGADCFSEFHFLFFRKRTFFSDALNGDLYDLDQRTLPPRQHLHQRSLCLKVRGLSSEQTHKQTHTADRVH